MPPSIAMEGYLEKRIQRPFGIVVWQKRHVMLTPSEIVVRNPQKKDETKRYLYESVVLAPFSAAPKGRVAFALLDAEEQETKLTLAAETKFEHGRWIRAVAEAQEAVSAEARKRKARRRRTAAFCDAPAAPRRRSRPPRERRRAKAALSPLAPARRASTRRRRRRPRSPARRPRARRRSRRSSARAAPKPAAPRARPRSRRCSRRGAEARGARGRRRRGVVRRARGGGRTARGGRRRGLVRRAPPAPPARPTSAEVEFVRGPLGLMFDDLAGSSNRAVITGTTETGEHFASLKVGDEIVGVAGESFFEHEADVEAGGEGLFTQDDVYDMLAEAVERGEYPFKVQVRRRAAAPKADTGFDEEKLAQYEKMVRMGCPAGGAMIKARTDGVDAAHLAELERRFAAAGNAPPPPPPPPAAAAAAEADPDVDASRASHEKMSAATLAAVAKALGVAAPARAEVRDAPASTTKGVHWESVTSPTAKSRQGSLWGRTSGRRNRESLGCRSELLFTENETASKLLEEMFTTTPAKAPKKGGATPAKTPDAQKTVEALDHQEALNVSIALAGVRGAKPWPPSGADDEAALLRSLVAVGRGRALAARAAARYDGLAAGSRPSAFALAVHAWGRANVERYLGAAATCADAPGELAAAAAARGDAARAALREDKQLRASLHSALALGNRLNRGTRRGNAAAVSLVQLERLDHTRGAGGRTPFDLLAVVLEGDASERGADGALDAAAIDAALRAIVPVLTEGAARAGAEINRRFGTSRPNFKILELGHIEALAQPEKTFDVVRAAEKTLRELKHFAGACEADERLGPRGGSDADDLAVAAFARRMEAATAPATRAAKAKAAVARLRDEQGLLRDYVDEKDLPIPVILGPSRPSRRRRASARRRAT
ncbi:hypothetical protein JL722_8348 [Aureococcus anophagefferens]|nr:hypothetical protein JL722_8348 [Aureococcus anophagefferens]